MSIRRSSISDDQVGSSGTDPVGQSGVREDRGRHHMVPVHDRVRQHGAGQYAGDGEHVWDRVDVLMERRLGRRRGGSGRGSGGLEWGDGRQVDES